MSTTKNQGLLIKAVLLVLFVIAIASPGKSLAAGKIKLPLEDSVYNRVEREPQFPGGLQAFMTFLGNNIHYPADDAKNKVQGKALVRFVIERDGSLTNIDVVRSPTKAMADEAIRVMKLSPRWTPGYQNGKVVRVSYVVPINYSLNK